MSDKNAKNFTFDPEDHGAEVPTLTSLLYRKNAVKSGGSKNSAPEALPVTLEPTVTTTVQRPVNQAQPVSPAQPILEVVAQEPQEEITGTSIDVINLFGGDTSLAQGELTPVATEAPLLAQPDIEEAPLALSIQGAVDPGPSDPIDRGFDVLRKRDLLAGAAVFSPQKPGQPHFTFSKKVGDQILAEGIQIDGSEFTDLFSRVSRFGFVEFPPTGSSGPLNSERLGFRTAFGVGAQEYLTLVRIGSSSQPEALVFVTSAATIQAHLPFFHTATTAKAA